MPYISGSKEQEDGHTFTTYQGFAEPGAKPYQYKTSQDVLRIVNRGVKDITVTVNSVNTTVNAGRDATIQGPFSQFSISSVSGNQAFTAESWVLPPVATNRFKASVMPTSGNYAKGDYVENANPSILGAASSKYVVNGWKRIVTGNAHVLNTDWVEDRGLTGQ